MILMSWIIFVAAALLEVGGDALVRKGLRAGGAVFVVAGCLALACYGIVVNTVKWDFYRMLGVYVAFFALVSIVTGRVVFSESVPASTWFGLALIMAGGLIIQFGPKAG